MIIYCPETTIASNRLMLETLEPTKILSLQVITQSLQDNITESVMQFYKLILSSKIKRFLTLQETI